MGAFEDAINLIRHAVYGEEVREGIASALELSMNTQQSVAGKEDSSNKVTTVNSNSTDIEYPSAKAVYDSLDNKESKSNKIETSINPSAASTTKYPSELAVVSYVSGSILQMANGKLSFDYQTTSISYSATNYKKVFTNAAIDTNIKGIVFTHPNSLDQVALCSDGTIRTRSPENNSYGRWEIVSEKVSNKVTTVNSNSTDIEYPSAKAVYDFVRTISQSNIKYNASTTTYDPSTREGVNTIYTRVAIESGVTGVTILGNSGTEFALCSDGTIRYRTPTGSSSYTGWINLIQKATSIGESNKTSGAYPTVQAVYNFVTAFVASAISGKANAADVNTALNTKADVTYVDNGLNTKADVTYVDNRVNTKADVTYVDNRLNTKADSSALTSKENLSNKITTRENLITNKNSTDKYPAAKAIVDYIAAMFATVINNGNKSSNSLLPSIKAIVDYLTANYTDTTALNTLLNGKMDTAYAEDRRNRVNELDISIEPNPDNMEYPSAYAVWMIANNVYNDLSLDISGNSADIANNSADIANIQAYIGYTESDILGLHANFQSNAFIRIAGAEGLTAGEDFDGFSMFGGRRRCNVADDGTINAFYGDAGYTEDGSNGQVMVYQPKFYYKVVPLKLEKQASGLGYHIRKANYYVTATPHAGFKLHPLFYDANGNEVEYVLLSAYEGSLYDVSESAYINDNAPGSYTYAQGDLLCSVAGKKPVSGKMGNIGTKTNLEGMAQAHGTGWHLDTIKSVSANQLLMAIELGQFNTQAAIGKGVVDNASNGEYNCASLTGSTAELGNETGMASATIFENGAGMESNTTNSKVSVGYRGVENPWGNIWKHINGINLWGDGTMNGGQIYIADDFDFHESRRSGNYKAAGFTVSNRGGYVSAFGYGDEEFDWLFIPSEITGNSSFPVGDNYWCTPNLNGYRIALLGGGWTAGDRAGGFYWDCSFTPGYRYCGIGGRLLYVPTATV